MKKMILFVAALVAVAGTQFVLQLQPQAVITIEAWSPEQLAEAGMDTHQSAGLSVVGVGSLVYLRGSDAEGEDVLTYEWHVTAPSGQDVAVDVQGEERTTFRPPEIGRHTVELTITTASGTSTTTTEIVGAEYVGVGVIAGGSPSYVDGNCGACHYDNTVTWLGTGHASFFTRAIDGLESSHYNAECIQCHTLGYDESADNGGFDDLAEELGWAFPSTLAPGNWQNIVDNFPELAQLTNIQCESCHGPGSLHKGNVANIDISVEVGVCAQCHEEPPYHVKPVMWRNSKHATGSSFSRGTSSSCAGCHSSYGFIARIDPLSNLDQQVGKGEGVTCAACHDPHDAGDGHPHQLRTVDDVELIDGTVVTWGGHGKLCMNCHHARRTGIEQVASGSTRLDPHHSPQTDMLAGNTGTPVTFGRYLPSSTHRVAVENACVGCHMAPTPAEGEPGHFLLGDHTWAMEAEENGEEVQNTAVCTRCHGEIASFHDIPAREDYDGDGSVETTYEEIIGVEEELEMLLPPVGSPEVDSPDDTWNLMQKYALFNLNFVEDDGTHGIHNYQFAMALLKVSIEAVQYGVAAPGEIQAVTDVPNDQGRQVQVVWERFGGDGVSTDPITMYYVWRKDAGADAGKGLTTTLDKVDVENPDADVRVMVASDVWTAVASAPAAQLDQYSAVAPTLYDGEDSPATFMVTGHTASGIVSMSDEFQGYSIDNLVPHAPTGVMASTTSSDVTLTWDDPVDADFDYFAVYRSTLQGFDPAGTEPMTTTTEPTLVDGDVVVGTTYYYQIAAYDFSGNQGEFSGEVQAALSTAAEELGLPSDFALHQNYPNPFNPTTTVSFDVPVASDITIAVYDLLGRQVRTLVNTTEEAGRHQVTFDASGLTSGLYIVRMRTGDRVFERSVVLMK